MDKVTPNAGASLFQRMANLRARVECARDEIDVLCAAMDSDTRNGEHLLRQLQEAWASLDEARDHLTPNFLIDQMIDPVELANAQALVASEPVVAHG